MYACFYVVIARGKYFETFGICDGFVKNDFDN